MNHLHIYFENKKKLITKNSPKFTNQQQFINQLYIFRNEKKSHSTNHQFRNYHVYEHV